MKRTVELVDAGRTLLVAEKETVLAAALGAGVPFPHSCAAGHCGACRSRLIAGEVELLPHSRFALSAEERGQGLILACRAMPRSDLVISAQGGAQATPEVRYGQATVLAKHEIAPSIFRLVRRLQSGTFDFLPGQYFDLGFPGTPLRSFSPASQPGSDQIEFHIRALPGGSASAVVSGHLAAGDTATINGPYGDAYLRETHRGPLRRARRLGSLSPCPAGAARRIFSNSPASAPAHKAAPARGATNPPSSMRPAAARFYPRPRAGGDSRLQSLVAVPDVSIHAPARGATP